MPAESAQPVSAQTIANAYGSYAAKSLEQTGSFFAQLAGVRSFNKAFQLQNEFAKQAYETFVAESQKPTTTWRIGEAKAEQPRRPRDRKKGYALILGA